MKRICIALLLIASTGTASGAPPNFVDNNTALPGLKTDKLPPTNPSQQWTASDANTVFNALADLRAVEQREWVNVKAFGSSKTSGVVGDGTDDTAAIQAAITATAGRTLYFPRGKYLVSSTLAITTRFHHLVGDFAGRNVDGGTEISFTGTGPCFQIGTDNGHPWDANDYDGPQDQEFDNLWISHGASDTALASNPGGAFVYKAGAYGIWDWRGGQVVLRHVGFEHFEASFVGVQSDIDVFDYVISLYTKYGLYFGPRSDQVTVRHLYSFLSDRAVTIDRAGATRIEDAQLVGCGTSTTSAIEIRQGSYGTRVTRPWLEHEQGYAGTDQQSFVSVGEVNGYGGTGGANGSIQSPGASPVTLSVAGMTIEDPMVISVLPGLANHTKYLATVGKCQQFVLSRASEQVNSALTNFDALVAVLAAFSPSSTDTQILISGVPSTMTTAQLFSNLGGGSPAVDLDKFGASGRVLASNVTLGGSTTAVHVVNGTLQVNAPGGTNPVVLIQNAATNASLFSLLLKVLQQGSYNLSSGFTQAISVQGQSVATKTGAGTLRNVGGQFTASGGDQNYSLETVNGDAQFNTGGGSVFFNRQVSTAGSAIPVLSSCGTSPTILAGSTDFAGSFTTGSAATTCTMTFASAFGIAPTCVIVGAGGIVEPTYSESTTAVTVTVDVASTKYRYLCVGH